MRLAFSFVFISTQGSPFCDVRLTQLLRRNALSGSQRCSQPGKGRTHVCSRCGTRHRQGQLWLKRANHSHRAGRALGMAGHTGQACHTPRDCLRCRADERLTISMPLGLTRREMWSRVCVQCSAVMRVLWVINKSALRFIFSKSGVEMVKMSRRLHGACVTCVLPSV